MRHPAFAEAPRAPTWVSGYDDPVRTLVLLLPLTLLAQRPVPVDNEYARVVVATARPGPKGRPHVHQQNRVMVYLDKGAQRLEFQDGPAKDVVFEPGQVLWDTKGGLHTSESAGGTTFRVIEIELKKDGGDVAWPAIDPVTVAADVHKVEFENSQVRVLRVRLGPRQKIAFHEHRTPRVTVPLTEMRLEITAPDGTRNTVVGKPGDVLYGMPARHEEENLLDQPVELILVDLKG